MSPAQRPEPWRHRGLPSALTLMLRRTASPRPVRSPLARDSPELACNSKTHHGIRGRLIGDRVTGREAADREHRAVIVVNGCGLRHADCFRSRACFECQSVRGRVDRRDQPHAGPGLSVDHGAAHEYDRECRTRRDEQADEPCRPHEWPPKTALEFLLQHCLRNPSPFGISDPSESDTP